MCACIYPDLPRCITIVYISLDMWFIATLFVTQQSLLDLCSGDITFTNDKQMREQIGENQKE